MITFISKSSPEVEWEEEPAAEVSAAAYAVSTSSMISVLKLD